MDRVLGIPNFWNVVTNAPFLALGAWGLARLARGGRIGHPDFFNWAGVWASTAALGLGSTIFHGFPSQETLALDRACICAVTAFMAAHGIHVGLGVRPGRALPLVLLFASLGTVVGWHQGAGLAPYGIARGVATVGTLGLLAYGHRRGRLRSDLGPLIGFVVLFAGSVAADVYDAPIRAFTGSFPGHALKHLLAALAIASLGGIMVAEERAHAAEPRSGAPEQRSAPEQRG